MDGAMLKIVPMNDITPLRAHDLVLIVHDRQHFISPLPFLLREIRIDEARESDPIFKAQLLGTRRRQKAQGLASFTPINLARQIFS